MKRSLHTTIFSFGFRRFNEILTLNTRFQYSTPVISNLRKHYSTDSSQTFPSSALYVSGRKAERITSILNPDIFDLLFQDLKSLEQNLKARKMPLDLNKLTKELERFLEMKKKRTILKKQKEQLLNKIRNMATEEREKLNEPLNEIKQKWQAVSREVWDMEEEVVLKILSLPNNLLKITPLQNDEVLYVYKDKPSFDFKVKSHVELGQQLEDLFFSSVSPTAYYLNKSAAVFELTYQNYFRENFEASHYCLLSSPDTFRPVVVEGYGKDFLNPAEVLLLSSREDQRIENCNSLHLEGSASLAAFCAFHTKTVIKQASSLPIRYVSVGRSYQIPKLPCYGLFNSLQSTKVQFFIATENDYSHMIQEYENALELMKSIYKEFNIHFRIIQKAAFELHKTNSLETHFEMWSPFLQMYIPVGHICISGDYISKRLLCQYKNNRESKYLCMLHGSAVNIVHLLACIIENTQTAQGDYKLPSLM